MMKDDMYVVGFTSTLNASIFNSCAMCQTPRLARTRSAGEEVEDASAESPPSSVCGTMSALEAAGLAGAVGAVQPLAEFEEHLTQSLGEHHIPEDVRATLSRMGLFEVEDAADFSVDDWDAAGILPRGTTRGRGLSSVRLEHLDENGQKLAWCDS